VTQSSTQVEHLLALAVDGDEELAQLDVDL
jgi:hypothetical protein